MTDDSEEPSTPPTHRSIVSLATAPSEPSIPEETIEFGVLAHLVASTPLIDPEKASIPMKSHDTPQRPRRRSSISVLQSLLSMNHSIPNRDARKRNFLVGAGRQVPENAAHDISSCFPNGRMLTTMVVTWNTAEASKLFKQNYTPTDRETAEPKERMLNDMSDILLPDSIEHVSDMIIVCTQEMPASKNNVDWEILLQEVIGPTHVLYHSVHFGTLSLCIFLRRDLIWFCSEPEEDVVKFRAVNPVRTKASLVVTFNLFGTSFMVMNSHFESGVSTEEQANRLSNFQNTTTKISIPRHFVQRMGATAPDITAIANTNDTGEEASTVTSNGVQRTAAVSKDKTKACDCVLWAGDMNFRITLSHAETLAAIEQGNYQKLLSGDEFSAVRTKTGHPYADFKEAKIEFPPTYKFDSSSDTEAYAKHRTPSYTDRILYRDKPSSPIDCTVYQAVESVKHSDHKPVIAQFRIKLKPGFAGTNQSYGKFNQEVYKRGCQQRERHHTMGVGIGSNRNRVTNTSVCVIL